MGRVFRLRNVALVAILAVAAMLLLMSSPGDRTAEASDFDPEFTVTLSPAGPLVPGNLTTVNTIRAPDANFETLSVQFIHSDWTINAIDGSPSLGGVAGQLVATSTLGILNGPCTTTTPVAFPLHASVVGGTGEPDDGDLIGPADRTWSGFDDDFDADGNANPDGLSDAITLYPKFLDANLSRTGTGAAGPPLTRLYGDTIVADQPIAVNVLTYEPNALAGEFSVLPELSTESDLGDNIDNDDDGLIDAADPLGYPGVVLLQNPTASDTSSAITDFCTPLITNITVFGVVEDNPDTTATEETGLAMQNPAASADYTISLFQVSDRDGASHSAPVFATYGEEDPDNPCSSPYASIWCGSGGGDACANATDDDADGVVNDGCSIGETIQTGETLPGDGVEGDLDSCPYDDNLDEDREPFPEGDPDFDGIDSACDNIGVQTFDLAFEAAAAAGFPALSGLSTLPWHDDSECRAGPGDDALAADCDFDGFQNRQDNCPQMYSPGNPDTTEIAASKAGGYSLNGIIAADGGPSDDGIGNACDLNPLVPDGHYHEALIQTDVTVLPADTDGDLWPDFVEVLLGSAVSTDPEGGTEAVVDFDSRNFCSDEIDNDGDGFIDDDDAGCSVPENIFLGPPLGEIGEDGIDVCTDDLDNDKDGATDSDDDSCGVLHDIEILSVSGNTKTKELQTKGYSVKVRNNGSGAGEVVPVGIAVLPLTGCPPVGIDVDGSGDIAPPGTEGWPEWGENLIMDVNGDTILDTLAFTKTGVILNGAVGSANVDVFFSDCPGLAPPGPAPQTFDTTSADFIVLADACHLGDNKALAPLFGGAPCGGITFADGGIDIEPDNDGPVTRIVNVTDYLRIPCNPVICPPPN